MWHPWWWAKVLHCVLTSRLPSSDGNHSSFSLFIRKKTRKKEEFESTTIVANFVSHLRTPHQAKVPSRQSSSREVHPPRLGVEPSCQELFHGSLSAFGKSRDFYCQNLLLARNEILQLFGFWSTWQFKWWFLRKIQNSELENSNVFLFFDYT